MTDVKHLGETVADVRRDKMLVAAAHLIAERGFSETRIADVATRVGASPALVIYYFGTKDSLLTEALRWSERSFYTAVEEMLQETPSLRARIENLVDACLPESKDVPDDWGLWFDLWAQAFRHDEIKAGRAELDARWRKMIIDALDSSELSAKDKRMFAMEFAALLDGLSIQVALEDPVVDSDLAYQIAMRFAERELNLSPANNRVNGRPKAIKKG